MVRWIVFDDDTADAVVGKYKRGAAEIRDGENPLDAALALDQASTVILASRTTGRVLLADFVPKTASSAPAKTLSAALRSSLLPGAAKRPTNASRPRDKRSWSRRRPA
jgi:hypothetical protein